MHILARQPCHSFCQVALMRMKLNPNKCVFGPFAGKLLGFLVSHWGIVANLENIKEIEVMQPPVYIKDVQKVT
jgi:hypothetical protein